MKRDGESAKERKKQRWRKCERKKQTKMEKVWKKERNKDGESVKERKKETKMEKVWKKKETKMEKVWKKERNKDGEKKIYNKILIQLIQYVRGKTNIFCL